MKTEFCLFFIILLCFDINVESFGWKNLDKSFIKVTPDPSVTKVHLIYMNHLDVGYSDYGAKEIGFSANVINTYFHVYFPRAIELVQTLRSGGYLETFRYTTHPWLLYFYLNCPNELSLANIPIQCPSPNDTNAMNEAIKRKDILWHDGPMNMNFENLNQFGLNVSLNISANLNRMFGFTKHNRVLSIRDVPGVTRGIIRTLRQNDFVAITSGVNSGSAPPAVPPLCVWKAPQLYKDETNVPEIIYMQDPYGYPDPPGSDPNHPGGLQPQRCHEAPGTTEILCFMFRSDNMGPPENVGEILQTYAILRARYIKANIFASEFETFFSLVWQNRMYLPVIDEEMGDTWIQGTASDPKKFARFRAMQRLFQYYIDIGFSMTPQVFSAARFMIKPAEHTYGLNAVNDFTNWKNEDFQKVRNQKSFTDEELSWVEQRQYEDLVLSILGPDHILTRWIKDEFKHMEEFDEILLQDYKQISIEKSKNQKEKVYNFTCFEDDKILNVGFQNGAIVYLDTTDQLRISPSNPLGQLLYRTYNETDTEFFLKYYKTYWNTGYGKPNSTIYAAPVSQFWTVSTNSIYRDVNKACSFLIVVSPTNSSASTYYGMPDKVSISWDIYIQTNQIATRVYYDNKKPTRLMEALFMNFQPEIRSESKSGDPYIWYLSKTDEWINPMTVMFNGSQYQHTVGDHGVQISTTNFSNPIYQTIPWDTGITCPILPKYGPTVWPAPLKNLKTQTSSNTIEGVSFNIFNNVWNTNYIYWYPFHGKGTDNDARFKARFSTKIMLNARMKNPRTNNDDTLYFKSK